MADDPKLVKDGYHSSYYFIVLYYYITHLYADSFHCISMTNCALSNRKEVTEGS